MIVSTSSPLPTGTVDLLTTTVYLSMAFPISAATARTAVRSGVPSSPGGVPTAMKTISLALVASLIESEIERNPSRRPDFSISSTPGS
ncbi:MAG: hypothetical protein CNCCGFBP_01185 [Fimbriimonadaceae bacterium]|nr:hypothetical protein [Fimbriimonadaceae bacterium]